MKKGDKVYLNCQGGVRSELVCIGIFGGYAYYGIGGNVVVSGVVWELINQNTISLQ